MYERVGGQGWAGVADLGWLKVDHLEWIVDIPPDESLNGGHRGVIHRVCSLPCMCDTSLGSIKDF